MHCPSTATKPDPQAPPHIEDPRSYETLATATKGVRLQGWGKGQ